MEAFNIKEAYERGTVEHPMVIVAAVKKGGNGMFVVKWALDQFMSLGKLLFSYMLVRSNRNAQTK